MSNSVDAGVNEGSLGSLPELPMRQVSRVPVEFLTFDIDNPRFAIDHGDSLRSETDIIQELIRKADVRELVESIASNGYIDIEPVIVMKEGTPIYIVLEGNRRLAAIKLLKDSSLAAKCGFPLPEVPPELHGTFDEISVYRVPDRVAARAFIGFKHINGPHAWDSLAKGRFAADWYAKERENGVTLAEIARKLGDNHATVKRLVQGIYVLDQAQDCGVFSTEDVTLAGRSLSRIGIQH